MPAHPFSLIARPQKMTQPAAAPGVPHPHVEARRIRLLRRLERPVSPFPSRGERLARSRVEHLVREAEELYWNELGWEEITEEERIGGGHLTELVFPGFLAFVDALLREPASAESGGASPRPEVVEEILLFLGARYTRATEELVAGADSESLVWARLMTAHLIDLVLYRLYAVSAEEREELEDGE